MCSLFWDKTFADEAPFMFLTNTNTKFIVAYIGKTAGLGQCVKDLTVAFDNNIESSQGLALFPAKITIIYIEVNSISSNLTLTNA